MNIEHLALEYSNPALSVVKAFVEPFFFKKKTLNKQTKKIQIKESKYYPKLTGKIKYKLKIHNSYWHSQIKN